METKFSKNKVVTGNTPFFVIGPFRTSHSICPNILAGQFYVEMVCLQS